MNSLINSNFNRSYNPSGRKNVLSEIKRLLTSRDTAAQSKAIGYLIEVVSRYQKKSEEGGRTIEYLLDNDITVFLCEATSNLDFSLFKLIISCLRRLWHSERFFVEEHSAHSLSAVLRSLAHYAASGPPVAVDCCLHFIHDLLHGISNNKAISPLSHQSAYSAEQLLACLNALVPQMNAYPNTVLSSALVLEALISYQPAGLYISSNTAKALLGVIQKWLELLMAALNRSVLMGEGAGMIYVVVCQLGMDTLRLIKLLNHGEKKVDFVHAILADDQDINVLKQCSVEMSGAIQRVVSELVLFTKEHQNDIETTEYGEFLKFLLNFFYETSSDVLPDFCDMLFSGGYLTMLPQAQIIRNDSTVRKASTLVLGELLKVLADKYLNVTDVEDSNGTCAKDINMGLVELQYGIEKPQSIGIQLQKSQPYSLLIYIYFYCQSSENPAEATAPLLPYLVEHILRLPKSFKPPPYIIKALWLVFAMSTLSKVAPESVEHRVYTEQATDRLVSLLLPEPAVYYTHNPAILLWGFISQRIPHFVRFQVLSQWLKLETSLPSDLTTDPIVWELLLNIVVQSNDRTVVENCMESLHVCIEDAENEVTEHFTNLVWVLLPDVLSKAIIGEGQLATNITYLLDLATSYVPLELDPTLCVKTALLITVIFCNNAQVEGNTYHFQCVCLKLCLYLLGLANNANDNRVLITFVNRVGFLPSVLTVTNSADESVASAALQLLSYIVHYFTKNNYTPKSVLQIQTHQIVTSLHRDSASERGASVLQLVYMVLNSGVNTPLALGCDVEDAPVDTQQCSALRALMFSIQLMLCTRDSKDQSSAGWKTLSAIFKHAISKSDTNLIATLTSQPWTFTLVQFHVTKQISAEFLTFLQNWLTFLKITIKNQEQGRSQLKKNSLVSRTMLMVKKNLVGEKDQKEAVQKITEIVNEIIL